MKYFIFLLSVLGTIIFKQPIKAQYEKIEFNQVGNNEKIYQSHILSIFQDSYGFLWFGTYNGLYRYDGYNFYRYSENLADSSNLIDFGIHVIYEDDKKQLWFGTENGLLSLNKTTGEINRYQNNPKNPNSISSNYIKAIKQSDDTTYLIGTYGGGLNILDLKTRKFRILTTHKNDTSSISSNLINTIFIDKDGDIWVGTEGGGINLFNKEKNSFTHFYSKNHSFFPD
jgi:ligand-binding sensor domain-containing protein